MQAEIGAALDAWPTPFPSRRVAVEFFGGGAVAEGRAAGLEERAGGWWPSFDRNVMVDALTENARRSFWDDWAAIACSTLVILGQSGIIPPVREGIHAPTATRDGGRERPRSGARRTPGNPEIVRQVLREFLEQVADRPVRGRG
ncbi:hypothetical protein [Streptomyces sp. WM6372]|uniref:hypothetical protein n=1 Tax=Streptomyces sp. WM6372 TaxID=1415555 RepID=UPI002D21DE26|nr:hypothetical protein [Streptomyces sp. WM6372]